MYSTPHYNLKQLKLQAKELRKAHAGGDQDACRRIRIHLRRFKDISVPGEHELSLAEAQLIIARENGFRSWPKFKKHIEAGRHMTPDAFEKTVSSIITGDANALLYLLDLQPDLVHGRSDAPHRATLLHYVSANGVEDHLQKTPANAVEIADMLLDAGAAPDALAQTYGGGLNQTTLCLLVSSVHPAAAGVQADLVHSLARAGAMVNGLNDDGYPIRLALQFGYLDAAEALADCGAQVDHISVAAGLGRIEQMTPMIDREDMKPHLEEALLYAARNGRIEASRVLLDGGVNINAQPEDAGTALHDAILWDRPAMVRFLVEHGADLSINHGRYNADPLDFASFNGKTEIVRYLLNQGADDLTEALQSAVKQGHATIAELLVAHGAGRSG